MQHKSHELFLHPFLITLFPVISLFAGNLGVMRWSVANRSLLLSLITASILFFLLRLMTKNWRLAAVLTSFYLIVFFSYGHVYNLIKTQTGWGVQYGRHRILGLIWFSLGILGSWLIIKRIQLTKLTTITLNWIGVLLVVLPVIQIVNYQVKTGRDSRIAHSDSRVTSGLSLPKGVLPDIYYIILDRYARADVIASQLGYDDSQFTSDLEKRGFYIAGCSRSNYHLTVPSIASTLNMRYFDELNTVLTSKIDQNEFVPYISDNVVRRQLAMIGYHIVSLTANANLQWPDADFFYDPNTILNPTRSAGYITPFEALLLRTTLLRIILDLQSRSANQLILDVNYPYATYIEGQLFILNKIPELSVLPSPIFAYIHINLPHPPDVFGPNGELVAVQTVEEGFSQTQKNNDTSTGYIAQLQYINQRMLAIVDRVIANSDHTTIIIIQGDHGFAGIDSDAILNAYLVPDVVRERLYPTITPVNTFRILFSTLFDGHYPSLPDISYLPGDEDQTLVKSTSSPVPCSLK